MNPNSPFYQKSHDWQPPADWKKVTTIDMHTEGEPLRVFIGGVPTLEGDSILAYRRFVRDNYDSLRTALMWEPRGHADMYGCIVTPPESPEADFGVLFLHNEGYSTMCGHAIIAMTTLAVNLGWVEVSEPETCVKIDAPAGLITAYARVKNGEVTSVYFHNVPSFLVAANQQVEVPGMGKVVYDLAFGGAFYAYVDARPLGLGLGPENFRELIDKGMRIKRAVMETSSQIVHPYEEDLSFLYGTIFIGDATEGSTADNRNVCIFAEGEVDRCPTGTGVSGRVAIHHAKGELAIQTPMIIESIIGTNFTAKVVEETQFGGFGAIIPEVEGRAYITGKNEFWIDPKDPLRDGFILR